MVEPYCSRTLAYSVASASVPRAAPTRSAHVTASARARHRAASSGESSSRSDGDSTTPAAVLVMSTDVSSCRGGDGSRPSARRRSSAITGPRNGTSTRPRANSSATMATSTPDAPSERSVRKPVASTAFSSREIRASSSRSATDPGPRSSASLAAASHSCCSLHLGVVRLGGKLFRPQPQPIALVGLCRGGAVLHRPGPSGQDPFHLTGWGVTTDLRVGRTVTNDARRIDLRIEHNPLLRAARSLTVNVLSAPHTEVPARMYLL